MDYCTDIIIHKVCSIILQNIYKNVASKITQDFYIYIIYIYTACCVSYRR